MGVFLWIVIVILAIILLVGVLFGLPATKGWAGERAVRTLLKTLPKDKYIILNDVKFYGRENENKGQGRYKGKSWSCQIDHLVISPYGIFCIETKNYLGKISGNYQDKYLTRRVLWMKYQTLSPIYQNYRHLQRLVETFPLIKSHSKGLHSIICFMPGGNPKIFGKGAATICKAQNLKQELMQYQNPIISRDKYIEIAKQVKTNSINHRKNE